VDEAEMYAEALKYYANILAPFCPMVTKKIIEILALNLPLDMICPSHGVIWKDNPAQIVKKYLEWADNYKENKIAIVYDSMWNSTRKMAEAIALGLNQADKDVEVKLLNSGKTDKNDILTEVFSAKAVLVGSSTINNGYLYSIGGILEMIKGLKLKGKTAAAFGSYGWSGEAVKQISEHLKSCGLNVVDEGLKTLWVPDDKAIEACVEYGKKLASLL
jgi:flavorubredoxin